MSQLKKTVDSYVQKISGLSTAIDVLGLRGGLWERSFNDC